MPAKNVPAYRKDVFYGQKDPQHKGEDLLMYLNY